MHKRHIGTLFSSALVVVLAATPSLAELSTGGEITISSLDLDEHLPRVAYNTKQHEYLVVWHDSSPFFLKTVVGQRYSDKGAFIAEYTFSKDIPPRDNAQPDVACDTGTGNCLVVWVQDVWGDGSDYNVMGRLIPPGGPTDSHAPFTICNYTSKQWNPRVAYSGTTNEFMVTWWNEGTTGVHGFISARRVSAAGAALDKSLDIAYGSEERVHPDLAYNQARNEYLITYQVWVSTYNTDICAVRMNATVGSILGGGEFCPAGWPDDEQAPAVASTAAGNEWAVAWHSYDSFSDTIKNIYVRRLWVDSGGTVQMAPPVMLSASAGGRRPDIAISPDGGSYLVVWEQQYLNGTFGISGQTLNTANVMGDSVALRVPDLAELNNSILPALAAGPESYFGVWGQERNNTATYLDIHGAMVFPGLFSDDFETGDLSAWSSSAP